MKREYCLLSPPLFAAQKMSKKTPKIRLFGSGIHSTATNFEKTNTCGRLRRNPSFGTSVRVPDAESPASGARPQFAENRKGLPMTSEGQGTAREI